ncbi:uncharacterized protein LOC143142630 [Alosa pseudoharengus]|uniref:uncharacterized protein LOC143142630 n=1 Tax=Alosa pseudoharengus TaxID=34774 RepID=UPI003F8B5333
MRLVFICALLVLSVSFGEALKCNFCTSEGTSCVPSTQTCPSYMDTCGIVLIMYPTHIIRSCMTYGLCQNWMHMRNVSAICCSTDLCN